MIKARIDDTSVRQSYKKLYNKLMKPRGMGKVLQYTCASIWVPNIKARLGVSTSTSGYQAELDQTMNQLDPVFVQRLGGQSLTGNASSAWADRLESERRVPGGYNRGEIVKAIEQAIKVSDPRNIMDGIAVGIGSFNELDNLFPMLDNESAYRLWQIIHYGTGSLGAKGSPVVRTGKQIFFNRRRGEGVLTWQTTNPGFKGREFFVKMDNTMHESDYVVRSYIIKYMQKVVQDLSSKRKK
jgi:hypothetical protein